MTKNQPISQYFSTGSWIPVWILLVLVILSCTSVTGLPLRITHLVESGGGVKTVMCFPVDCPIGHTVKICEEDGMKDQCVPCPDNMEQLAITSSQEIRPCILKESPCAEDEIMVDLPNGTRVCQCKPSYCGHPPNCLYKHCDSGFTLDLSTCTCRPELTAPVTTTTLPPDSASPAKVMMNDTSTGKMSTTMAPPVPQSPSTSPAPTETSMPPTSGEQVSALTPGAIGAIVGIVLVIPVLIVLVICLVRRCNVRHQSQRPPPQVPHVSPVAPSEDRPNTTAWQSNPHTVVINNANCVQFGYNNTVEHTGNGNGHATGHPNGHANGYANGIVANGHGPPTSASIAAESDQDDVDDEGDGMAEALVKDGRGRRLPVQEEGQALLEDGPPPSPTSLCSDVSETLPKGFVNT